MFLPSYFEENPSHMFKKCGGITFRVLLTLTQYLRLQQSNAVMNNSLIQNQQNMKTK